jgi:hypothetical protein
MSFFTGVALGALLAESAGLSELPPHAAKTILESITVASDVSIAFFVLNAICNPPIYMVFTKMLHPFSCGSSIFTKP